MKDKPNTNFTELILNEIFKHSVSYYQTGQKKCEQFYTDGLLLFKEIYYSETGQIKEIINYKAGTNEQRKYSFAEERVKSGMLICYHENGTVQSQKYFVGGKINWEEKMFSESGQLLEVINYKKGTKSGSHKIYNEKGILLSDIYFEKDIPDGPAHFYYDNGMMKAIINYKDGKKNGVSKFYYENGIMKIEETFEDDTREGYIKTFYNSGGLKEDWEIHHNLPEGNCSFYYKTGMIYGTKKYQDGKEEGLSRFYYENGKLKEEIYYSNGLKNGVHKMYNMYGELEKELVYNNGQLVDEKIAESKKSIPPSNAASAKSAAIRTMNYVGLSAASLLGVYLLYSLVIYLFG